MREETPNLKTIDVYKFIELLLFAAPHLIEHFVSSQ